MFKILKKLFSRKKPEFKRVMYIAKCDCGWKRAKFKNPPKCTQCPNCKIWVDCEEFSWTGKDRF